MDDVQKMLLVVNNRCLTDLAKLVGCSVVSLSKIKTGVSNPYNVRWFVVDKLSKMYNDEMRL